MRVSPLTEVWDDRIRIIGGIEMKILAPFAQRAGRVDWVATIPQQREPGLTDVVSHNYATGINSKLRKETRLPVVIEVRSVELKEDIVAIVITRMAEEDM